MTRDRPKKRRTTPSDWENLPEDQLLEWRIRDLGLRIDGSLLEEPIRRLYRELDEKGISFHPPCYLADEWFCPDRVPVIGIPFCLAHPRLKQIEQRMMLEVEGGTDEWCMKLLRHEAGHTLNYAFRLYRRTRWRTLFGHFSERYSTSYRFYPYSKRYVIHLEDNYAQAHPDEDFAETFAVWLTPGNRWQERYRDWPVIAKLRYIDTVMRRIGSQTPPVTVGEMPWPWAADRMTSTLSAYYRRKRVDLGDDFAGYYDPMLRRLFPEAPDMLESPRKASRFLRAYQRRIVESVTAWTGRRKYDVNQLMTKLVKRCDILGLRVGRPDAEAAVDVAAFVTAVANRLDYPLRRSAES